MKNGKQAAGLFPTRIAISADARQGLTELLNTNLATLTDLFTQTKHAHWNVKGPQFWSLHKLFDELAEKVEEHVDEVAERLTALGGAAKGTVRMAAKGSKLAEFPDSIHAGMDMVTALSDAFGVAANLTRDGINEADKLGDPNTADLFTQISRDLDQSLYFLESHLQVE
jgi:starvation-inducible DNA-binding protein